ncbi:strawberry notch family protein [Chamaesiphon polymorphus]|uniref:Helicase ATP-binding domain-containing protein n=1 Tax=Chamaesiphon polymorphus CCALA 037 TaxID=2107692 RepID=A0A2T1G2U9_9CYAN|nr:strawberry notch family protein [Chamaesiphon polymorphus]PSB51579.1 hypothetical protein C7B77_21445 [Chamaesiphon polymorphus CCALA 037]
MPTITKTAPVREFLDRLTAGVRLEQPQIKAVMNDCYGSSSNGAWLWKQAYDAIEAAMTAYLLEHPKLSLPELWSLQDSVVDHTARSQEQLDLQQFSTPLGLGYLVARALALKSDDILLEPSAGTGMLAAIAINHAEVPQQVILNEFSKFRRELLTEVFPQAEIFSLNAEYINDLLLPRIKPTAIAMNPPFSRSVTSSKRNPDAIFRHLRSALLKLAPNGRLAAIVAHSLTPSKHPEYFASLPAKLLLSVYLDGKFYRHHGTTFPTRLLVFDKTADELPPPKCVNDILTLGEIDRLIDGYVPPRLEIKPESTTPASLDLTQDLPLFASISASINPFGNLPLFQLSGEGTAAPAVVEIDIKPVRSTQIVPLVPKDRFGEIVELQYHPVGERHTAFAEGTFEPYQPSAIEISDAPAHPTQLAESVAMAAIAAPYPTVTVKLPARIVRDGLASSAQLEALIYACEAHDKHIDVPWKLDERKSLVIASKDDPEGKYYRQGFFIGDATGVGKGREAALIILANWCEGRKRAIWLSKNEALLEDARRDWQSLGGDPNTVVPLTKYKLGEKIGLNEGILFVTFGCLRTAAKGEKKSRVEQILEWAGNEFDGAICIDEAHLLGNCAGEEGERGKTKASAQGLAGMELIDNLPDARVVYLSATGASKASNLAYCQRLGLWMSERFPFSSREQFIANMDAAGLAGLEMLTQDLKRMGKYISRTLSFDGVNFETLTHEITPEQQRYWDVYARAFEVIHRDLDTALDVSGINAANGKCLNPRAKCVIYSQFESLKLRFFNSLLCAVKAPTLIAAIERDIAAGYAAVVQLISTNEALLDRRLAEIPTNEWNDLRAIDFSAREVIASYVHNSFPIHTYVEYVDDNNNTKSELLKDANDNPVVCQEALAIRARLLEDIAILPPITGILDQLNWHFGHDRIAEITGRTKRILSKDGRYQLATRSAKANIAETDAFQSDRKQILIFSSAGGTGYLIQKLYIK